MSSEEEQQTPSDELTRIKKEASFKRDADASADADHPAFSFGFTAAPKPYGAAGGPVTSIFGSPAPAPVVPVVAHPAKGVTQVVAQPEPYAHPPVVHPAPVHHPAPYTMVKELPKYPVLEPIGKNFRFFPTQLLKIYQILVESYN